MSWETVRDAVTAFLAPPAVPGLNFVWAAPPRTTGGVTFTDGQPPGTASGAITTVNLTGLTDRRISIDGQGGFREIIYRVRLDLMHRSVELDEVAAAKHLDDVIEGILQMLRADPSLGGVTNILDSAHEMSVARGDTEQGTTDGSLDTLVEVEFPVTEVRRVT